ncbi:MAG: hypothetical protein M1836_001748 [Candelina mexicana]|nr:MAG: hypothetical protein M1836_001748 [Candelina mexicana]
MPLICNSLPQLHQEVSRLRNGSLSEELSHDKSDDLFSREILNMSDLTLSVYNIHGDLDHLIRIAYVAADMNPGFHMALIIVDQKHYDDAVALLKKHFPLDKIPESTIAEEDGVVCGHFRVIRGAPENRKARTGSEEEKHANWKKLQEGAIDRALHQFGDPNKAGERIVRDFVWHNATSAELLTAMPDNIMKKHCKAITFACGVILTPTSFFPGAHYSWDKASHDTMVARAAGWNTPIVYYHGSTMGLEIQTLSQLPGFTSAVAGFLPEKQWQRLLFESMDQVAVWLIRWCEGKAGHHGEAAVDKATEIFSEIPEGSREWAKKVFEAKPYPAEECIVKKASQRAVSIAQDIRCPVNQSLGMAAGMVFDNHQIPDAFLVPAKIDIENREVTVDPKATTYIMTSDGRETTQDDSLKRIWLSLLAKLNIQSQDIKLPTEIAAIWLEYTRCIATIAVPLGNMAILDEIVEGEMTQLANKALSESTELLLDHSV